ncbi:MAG: hypothetical protein CUN55_03635 [Phototrophicales bacterium]|nr:MAG: hypothetical protein CUN55_03635 [Phototrophicales bacterium]
MSIIIDAFSTFMIILYGALGESVVLAIVVFTVLVRLALMPLTLRSQRSMKRMQELSPKLRELQEKYKDDRQRLAQEQMNLYKEQGINPFAGCLPVLVQLPIIFSMWRVIIATLASTPQQLLDLQNRLLVGGLDHLVPMKNTFLWLNLSLPDPYFILPILVVITSYVQQKLVMPVTPKSTKPRKAGEPPDPSEQAQQITRQMTTFMPLMVGFFALNYASGLSIYFIVSNIFGIVQYVAMGKADWRRLIGRETPKPETAPAEGLALAADASLEEQVVAQASAAVAAPKKAQRELRHGISVVTLKPEPATSKSKASASHDRATKSQKSTSKPKVATAKSKKR